MQPNLDFLPGDFRISRGRGKDYARLARFHYRTGRPATFAGVWRVEYLSASARPRTVAVAVLSYPVPSCLPRRRALGITGSRDDELRFANQHIRTISRVIVHPQFRALGLSSWLVNQICAESETRYTEALAVMGRAHPFFERAGMTRHDPGSEEGPVYYLFERSGDDVKKCATLNVQRATFNFQY